MAAIYSKRFLTAAGSSAASSPPAVGDVWVIRCITAVNTNASGYATFSVVIGSTGIYIVEASVPSVGTGSAEASAVFDVRVPIENPEYVAINAQAGVDVSVSGYLFVV
jgi:hypothetical protein